MSTTFKQETKKLGVGDTADGNAGLSMFPDGAKITGDSKRSFLGAVGDTVNIGGKQVNFQIGPGQVKWMGGLMQSTPWPFSMIPVAPPMLPSLELIEMAVGIGIELAVMATLFFVSNAGDALDKFKEE